MVHAVVYARHFLSRINACFPYLLVFCLRLINELFIGALSSKYGLIFAKIGATKFPLIFFQFSAFIAEVMCDSE